MSVNEKMTAIAHEIRAKTGKTEKLTLDAIADSVEQIWQAGAAMGRDALWDAIQDYGRRTNYTAAFNEWEGAEAILPKYPVRSYTLYETFRLCSNATSLPTVTCANADGIFNACYCAYTDCRRVKTIDYDIYNKASGSLAWGYAFRNCRELVRIQKLGIQENQGFTNTFDGCLALQELRIDGVIGQNGLDLRWSRMLSRESILSVVQALSDTTNGLSVTFSAEAVDREFNEDGLPGSHTSAWNNVLESKSNWNIQLI